MKFIAALISACFILAAEAQHDQRMVKRHGRRGPSATYGPPTATLSSTPTLVATPTSTPTSGNKTGDSLSVANGVKRGLSFNDASLTDGFNSGEVSWVYNWASSYSGTIPENVMYFPMLWGGADSYTSVWFDNANAAIANGAEILLGMNEPDLSSQSNISPQDAATLWKTYMEPYAGKATLISPAVTNGGAPMGLAWLQQFFDACTDCTIDACAIHIYDSATNVAYYQSYISGAVTTCGKPVFVTEFGATGSEEQQQQFLAEMVPWLDSQPGIQGYAWFMDTVGNLVNSDGSLTSLGSTYIAN
ncbi:glycosyl hydrolase catalytic core-domain-containing protein [Sparassis latifolia]